MNEPSNESDVKFLLGEIRGQLTSLISLVTAKHAEIDRNFDRFEKRVEKADLRIQKLEQGKAWVIGFAAALGGLAGFLVDMLKS